MHYAPLNLVVARSDNGLQPALLLPLIAIIWHIFHIVVPAISHYIAFALKFAVTKRYILVDVQMITMQFSNTHWNGCRLAGYTEDLQKSLIRLFSCYFGWQINELWIDE